MRLRKRNISREMLSLAAFLLAGGLLLCTVPKPVEAALLPLADKDGIRVFAGAPEMRGVEKTFPRQTLLAGVLLLVSPAHPLPQDHPAPSTRTVRAQVGAYLPAEEETALREEVIYALCALQTEHRMEEGTLLTEGAVSAAQQEDKLREAFERYAKVYPLTDAYARAAEHVPSGGESEHQTGLALDIRLTGALDLSQENPLERNETGKWLCENMWRYGFIQRYTRKGEEGTCESIHLRYVGRLHAAAMHALDVSLEEYWALLRETGGLTLERNGEETAYILCRPCPGDLTVALPADAACEVSADNAGYATVVVYAKITK